MTEAKRGSVIRSCNQCSGEFSASAHDVKNGHGLFCSRKCFHDNGTVSRKCLVCEEQFKTIKAHESRKFCSRECSNKGMVRRVKKPETSLVCQFCGLVFLVDTTLQQVKRRYCSTICSNNSRRKPNAVKSFRKTGTAAYQKWVRAVLLRDQKCVRCGKTDPLQVHHVKSWKNHPELRYDVSNGVALCPHCHHSQHPYLSLEAFIKQGGKRVLRCVVCESPFVPKRNQQACGKSCNKKLGKLREKI